MHRYVLNFIQVPSEIVKNTCIQGKSKKKIHTKKFYYSRNAIQMSTNMLLSKYYPVIFHSFHQNMSENLLITIRETRTHWLRFYMVDQYRIMLLTDLFLSIPDCAC